MALSVGTLGLWAALAVAGPGADPAEAAPAAPVVETAPALEPSVGDLVGLGTQIGLSAAAGWVIGAPAAAAFVVTVHGMLPRGALLITLPLAPVLLAIPPVLAASGAALGGFASLSPWGVVAAASAAAGAGALVAGLFGVPALLMLSAPPPREDATRGELLAWLAGHAAASFALLVPPAAAVGLAAGTASAFFVEPPEAEGAE